LIKTSIDVNWHNYITFVIPKKKSLFYIYNADEVIYDIINDIVFRVKFFIADAKLNNSDTSIHTY